MNCMVYLSGPMSGKPDFNFPAFYAAAEKLRAEGYNVINPAEMDAADPKPLAWEDYLRRDIRVLLDCQAIALLPGWRGSKGASLEHHIAEQLGMKVFEL